MFPRRLSFFLLIALLMPTYQVIRPQRDLNAEETVVANFLRLRREAGLPLIKRAEGNLFSRAACEAAEHGNPDKVWVENANYAAMIYSTPKADDSQSIDAMAKRPWKGDQRLIVGVCTANTPAFPSGRYWVAMGVVGSASERSVADLLSGHPTVVRDRTGAQQPGE
ncbi:MAG TPA: hypothetical protein VG897_09690 [Terriglobales bacterium]|nr:hypothetical protein [Terriglobales bacterium]